MRTLIKNGILYDGLGHPPVQGDILIEGNRIADTAPKIRCDDAEQIDAAGRAVTPGFIDIHRHCDLAALRDKEFGRLELAQGITTTITGNCGLAPVPCTGQSQKELYGYIEPCLGAAPSGVFLQSYAGYLSALRLKGVPLHIGGLIGAGAVKTAVRGFRKGAFSPAEMKQAKELTAQAMRDGAFGLSMGIMYVPECYSSPKELADLASVPARYGGILTTHIRGEGDYLVESVAEVIEAAKRAEVPLHISHFKSTGVKNWKEKIFRAIELVEAARNHGQDVTVDFYPYTGGSTTLLSLLPPAVLKENQAETLRFLRTKQGRAALRREIYKEHPGWDNMVTGIGWERILISAVTLEKNLPCSGKSLLAASQEQGYGEPADFLCDLLTEEDGRVTIILLSMHPDDVDTVARLPYSILISDALYGKGEHPHPRLYGSFPKFIREYVYERRILPLETAVHKMTGLPAARMGIKNHGTLTKGACADILVFSPESIRDRADYSSPKQLSTGMDYIFVNGYPVWQNEQLIKADAGTVLSAVPAGAVPRP